MPTYVYKFVETGETIEVQQGFHDENLTEYTHPDTGVTMPVKKVFTPVGVTFKGSGFFKTDSRGSSSTSSKPGEATTSSGDSSSPSSSSSSSSGGSSSGKSDASSGGSGSSSSGSSSSSTSSSPAKPAKD